jgi:SAM-dependent methyltransferase
MSGSPSSVPGDAGAQPRPPNYLDAMIADFDADGAGRFNHLGHWDDPTDDPLGTPRPVAQQRMNDVIVEMAGVRDGARLLDVGCGFGGTLAAIERRFERVALTGLDVDGRQLAIASRLGTRAGNSLTWVNGDGCELPFADGSFDHMTSIEAMWHFPSRAAFLCEAARVLRPGGRLAVVDLLIASDAAERVGCTRAELLATLDEGFAPWPGPDDDIDSIVDAASAAGLDTRQVVDATENTKPTYLDHGDGHELPDSASFSATRSVQLFVQLHLQDGLRIVYLGFERASTTPVNSA